MLILKLSESMLILKPSESMLILKLSESMLILKPRDCTKSPSDTCTPLTRGIMTHNIEIFIVFLLHLTLTKFKSKMILGICERYLGSTNQSR